MTGLPPFQSQSEFLIFKKIEKLDYSFHEGFNEDAKNLVQQLLVIEPQDRYSRIRITNISNRLGIWIPGIQILGSIILRGFKCVELVKNRTTWQLVQYFNTGLVPYSDPQCNTFQGRSNKMLQKITPPPPPSLMSVGTFHYRSQSMDKMVDPNNGFVHSIYVGQ